MVMGDLPAIGALTHMSRVTQSVYAALLRVHVEEQGWGDVVTNQVMDAFGTLVSNVQVAVGQVRGVTCLPLPPDPRVLADSCVERQKDNSDAGASGMDREKDNKEMIHVLESALITWTKQIKNVLKQEPEESFSSAADGSSRHPGPLEELEFWEQKAADLNGIFLQLQSNRVRKILRYLDSSKSTYSTPFAKLCKEAFMARSEANDNNRYLRPLRTWLQRLDAEIVLKNLPDLFRPALHTLLLVWKSSGYYNSSTRLVVFVREMCNTLIGRAMDMLAGGEIFRLIEQDQQREAVNLLETTLKVLGQFKTTYFEYKAKAAVECPSNPWRVQNNAVFARMDAFLERCHDVLDLTQTIAQFQKLANLEVGGTKGKVLTTSVAQIHTDFGFAVDAVKRVDYDVMSLDEAAAFETSFQAFRMSVKTLERRLASVLNQAFDDCPNLRGRFRLLDCFSDLVHRPAIAEELQRKHVAMVLDFSAEVALVMQLFAKHKDNPPIAHNLPPFAGALTWSKGLLERVSMPMAKISSFDKKVYTHVYCTIRFRLEGTFTEKLPLCMKQLKVLGTEEARDLAKAYELLVGQLADFENENIKAWGAGIQSSIEMKLKNPLLSRDPDRMVRVNFDPLIVRLLREVKYFLLLGLRVPESALEVFSRGELFRRHTGNLDLIVHMYNNVEITLLPVERPLLQLQLVRNNIIPGGGVAGGSGKGVAAAASAVPTQNLNWRSTGIDAFIAEAMTEVKELSDTLAGMKGNLKRLEGMMKTWAAQPLFERSPKTSTYINEIRSFFLPVNTTRSIFIFPYVYDFTVYTRCAAIREGGLELHKLLKETNRKLKVSAGLPEWKNYVDFVNSLVRAVITNVSSTAMLKYDDAVVHVVIPRVKHPLQGQKGGGGGRAAGGAKGSSMARRTLRKMTWGWVEGFLNVSKAFRRLDAAEGTYLKEIQDDPEVRSQVCQIHERLDVMETAMLEFKRQFAAYEYLWTTDIQAMFREFLNGEEEAHGSQALRMLDLAKFDEKIHLYLRVQSEVASLRHCQDVGFVRVNAQPMKQAISTWATKWIYLFAQSLQDHVSSSLERMHSFISYTQKGLDTPLSAEDKDGIMATMTHIRDVRKKAPMVTGLFGPLKDTVLLLKSRGIAMDLPPVNKQPALEFLESAHMLWDNTVNKAYRVKGEIQPLQNAAADGVRKDIGAFGEEVRSKLRLLKMVWDMVSLVDGLFASWTATLWAEIRTDELLEEARSLQLHIRGLPRRVREWALYRVVDERVVNMSTVLPLIHELHSPAMRDRHWKELLEVTEVEPACHDSMRNDSVHRPTTVPSDPDLHIAPHLSHHGRHVEASMETVEVANKELKVETRLRNIENRWKEEQLGFVRHRDTEVFVLAGADEVLEALEDHQMQLQGMAGMGKFVDFFRQEVTDWQGTLGEVETFLKLMLSVQRQWTSLEAIFLTSKDIRAQLPDDTRRFEGIDLEFKDLMKSASFGPTVVAFCSEEERGEGLTNMHLELEKCEKALTEYLDMKKNVFPRFYFVSNAALLDILSNGNDPPKIQYASITFFVSALLPMYRSRIILLPPSAVCFCSLVVPSAGVPETAVAILAKDGERVKFHALFHMTGAVEMWLTRQARMLVTWMQKTLMLNLDEAVREAALWELDKPREEWLFGYPAELALLAGQILWTEECERSLEEYENGAEDAVKKYLEVCCIRLDGLIKLVQGELTRESRAKIITLITIDVHGRDVVQGLIDRRVESNLDFAWQSQLRYYWTPQICDFRSVYSFEFAGNCGRLVITPLTDRCYPTKTYTCHDPLPRSLTLRDDDSGAPAGPAGTGKTETTKDLARGLGLPCYVFNCSDQMNYRTMADIFKGLTQVGAWGCFDEFNRISIEVLSVVASQVKCIQDAVTRFSNPDLREPQYQHLPAGIPNVKVGVFDFLGEAVSMIPTCGFFITMNPGYAGRTELPENLKALFRSCAMIRPDLRPICENMLMAEGFVKARALAVKFVTLYSLSSELLSKQVMDALFDRSVKSVLLVAGKLKRCDPDIDEEAVLMRALRDFNTPKIISADTPIFLRLIADLFPSMDLAPKVNEVLSEACASVCVDELSLQPDHDFVVKVVQFQELLDVRHSVMILGPAGCGKTTVWKTLMACHNRGEAKPSTVAETVNPKAVTSDELYGYMTLGKEWKDGVLSIIMRNMSKEWAPFGPHQTMKWVILDGDIDAVWIESMNTVMDDNKVLTLVSNERIPLTAAMRMIFEIHSLKNATPATVSRAGILFVNEVTIAQLPRQATPTSPNRPFSAYLVYCWNMEQYFLLNAVRPFGDVGGIPQLKRVKPVAAITDPFLPLFPCGGCPTSFRRLRKLQNMERVFLFAAMWSFGGALSSDSKSDDRRAFSQEWRRLLPPKTVKIPEQGLVFDYFINPESGEVVRWSDKVPTFVPSVGQSFASMVVPTMDLIRLTFLTGLLVDMKRHVMLIGSVGTGKTSLVQSFLRDNASESLLSCTINTSFYTDAAAMQRQLEQPLDKRSGKTYGPPSLKRLIYFVDDMNMPFIEEYGTQTPIALLRQYMDYRGWYDRSDLGLRKKIVDVQFLGAMNHKSGSFSVNPRLQRHFVTLGCQTPGDNDLTTIYGAVIGGHLSSFSPEVRRFGAPLLEATICLHRVMCAKFLPTAVKFYYGFNLRDISCLVQGLCMARPESCTSRTWLARLWRHECEREYNETHATMNLVLFDQAMHHVARISRILQFPRGNALLLGVGGSGKQTLCKLAAHISGCEVSEIAVTSDYGVADLRAELKELYRKTGVKPALPLVFMLTDSQIVDERFLVYVNDLLTSGVIPDLFTKDEFDAIFQAIKLAAKSAGVPDVRDSLMQFFVDRVRANLHVVLCFSPVGDAFRSRCRRFPGLINCTQIDLFRPWPRDALVKVSLCFLEDMELGDDEVRLDWEVRSYKLTVSQRFLEDEGRYNYTTPKSFLELIDFYKELLRKKQGELDGNINRLANGLETLKKTNGDVQTLRDDLKLKMKDVEAKKQGTEVLLEEMGVQRSEAEAQQEGAWPTDPRTTSLNTFAQQMPREPQAIADIEKSKADLAASNARTIEIEAEMELAVAKPALLAAQEAVNCLDKASLTELKSFSKPPPGVDLVTTALLIMIKLEKKNFSWENAKKMMAKVDAFKEQLEEYRGEDVPEEVVKRVQPLLLEPDFTYAVMKTKSAAAANLCNWVINIINFNQIYKKVKPLMDALEAAQAAKAAAIADLAKVEDALAVIKAHLGKLEKSFMAATEEKTKVEGQARACQERLGLAERLTNGLASENERWGEEVERLQTRGSSIVGDVLLAAAFVSYAGAFSKDYRQELWRNRWLPDLTAKAIPLREGLDPLQMLTSDSKVAEWQNERLPSDQISIENGGIITQCQRWPLMIDPQLQGISGWGIVVVKGQLRTWASSTRIGYPTHARSPQQTVARLLCLFLLLVSKLLQRAVIHKGSSCFLRMGGEDCEYDPAFRLYLQTRLSNPHYRPEVFATCTLINFIVTERNVKYASTDVEEFFDAIPVNDTCRGLEDQLLASVVGAEQPELEKTKNDLVQASNRYKMQLEGLEDQLLQRLADAPADILADVDLIEGLEEMKETAREINEAVTLGKETEAGINEARSVYRPVAAEASLMYFMLLKLSSVDFMYQYSLDSFTRYFHVTKQDMDFANGEILTAPSPQYKTTFAMTMTVPSDGPPLSASLSLSLSRRSLRFTVYSWITRGLFEKHRLIFLTQVTFGLLKVRDRRQFRMKAWPLVRSNARETSFSEEALAFLLKGGRRGDGGVAGDDPPPADWLSDSAWRMILALSTLDGFSKLANDVAESAPRFREWFDTAAPELEKLPLDWRELDKRPFLKLLVVRCLRPDRITQAIAHFVRNNLPDGPSFADIDAKLNSFQVLSEAFRDSDPTTPIYFILSAGANVTADVDKLADKHHMERGVTYHDISLGQVGRLFQFGSSCGHWVVLNNIHLMPRWLPSLDKRLDYFKEIGSHTGFRVMLSSDPSNMIPVGILQRCINLTNDPPSGLRANLKQAFASFSREEYGDLEPRTQGILFGLCHFHALMLERRKFGPKGFNMMYPFSSSDLTCSVAVLKNYMENAPQVVRDAKFDLEAIAVACDNDLGPYENILMQECERMNLLVGEIVRTLTDLCLAFKVTQPSRVVVAEAIHATIDVPSAWEKLAYPSMRSLPLWISNLQLSDWVGNPTEPPTVTWLSGLFNPQSFLTAIMQMDVADISASSREGAYVNGLSLDGARWNLQASAQHLESSKPREMYFPMPVITCVAVVSAKADSSTFMCPVYKTQQRGPTYVFDAGLRTKAPTAKWVLAGVVLVMDIV
eukprot:jgi/Undpi1/12836/HiC_scaffold_7.g02503.m1